LRFNVLMGMCLAVSVSAFAGKRMPETPKPEWLKPPPNHKPEDNKGCPGHISLVLRGACWEAYPNPNRNKWPPLRDGSLYPCPSYMYDPPPEADYDAKQLCFEPIIAPTPPAPAPTPAPAPAPKP
jgi:hypothetical protein